MRATGLIAACCDAQEMIYRRPGVERDLAKMIDLALEHVLPSAASRAAQTSWRSVPPPARPPTPPPAPSARRAEDPTKRSRGLITAWLRPGVAEQDAGTRPVDHEVVYAS